VPSRPVVPTTLVAKVLVAMVLVAVAGCSGGTSSAAGPATSASSSSPSATATPTSTPTATPSSTPSVSTAPRTSASLTKALLALADLPAGFQQEDTETDEPAPKASSSQARCRDLVRLSNLSKAPGTKASVTAAFSGGQSGPFIGQQLDALGSARAVTSIVRSYAAAVKACRTLRLTIPGQGTSTVDVRTVSPPEEPGAYAVRFTASSGALEGLEITQVFAPVTDVLLTLTFIQAAPEDVEGATGLAADKARTALGTAEAA
jgi:hypothetical protein